MPKNPRVQFLNRNSQTARKTILALEEFRTKHKYKNNNDEYFHKLDKFMKLKFPKLIVIGNGISRRVWMMNHKTVMKIQTTSTYSEANTIERDLSFKYPKFLTKPYLHYVDNQLDILISEKVRILWDELPYVVQDKYRKEQEFLKKTFCDMHENNYGLVGKRVVGIDVGFGER